jgi:RNA polymerase sigma-B factor
LKQSLNRQLIRRNARVKEHMRLVEPVARHYAKKSGQDADDLHQVGLLGLLKAAERYDIAREIPFAAYARPHIRGAILHYLRDRASIIRMPRSVQEPNRDMGAGFNAASQRRRLIQLQEDQLIHRSNSCDDLDLRTDRQQLAEAMTQLPDQERMALIQVVLKGQSLRKEAQRSGVSAMTVQRRVKRGLARLRDQFTDQLELA